MDRTSVVLILSGLLVAGCWENTRKHPLQVTYIANEGFALAMGDTKILIDAFPRSKYYLNPTDTLAANWWPASLRLTTSIMLSSRTTTPIISTPR